MEMYMKKKTDMNMAGTAGEARTHVPTVWKPHANRRVGLHVRVMSSAVDQEEV
jgi:hypothetical protein